MRRANRTVLRWLIFCFPAGLLMMWSDRCTWPRATKSLVSLAIAAVLTVVLLPQTSPPERVAGGVQIVSLQAALQAQGPKQQLAEGQDYEAYVPIYVPEKAVLVEPTPTPVPIYVYCNDGGRYYHSKECRYTKRTTPKVTLSQAVNAGFKKCESCNAPSESLVQ